MTARRILFINYEYPPIGAGGANATRQIAREMARRGHEPFVLTAAWRNVPEFEVDEGVTVRRVPALRRWPDRSSFLEWTAFMAASLLRAPGCARRWKIDAVIAFFTLPCGPAAALVKRTAGLPYVIALRGGDVPGFDPPSLGRHHALTGGVTHALWRDADAVVANSDGLAGIARRHAPNLEIRAIPQGADVSGITAKPFYGNSDGVNAEVALLAVGRLAEHKALDVLLTSLAILPKDLKWRLSIVGDGPERSNLAALAAKLGLSHRVRFNGWAGRADLPDIYRAADVFVLPSREEGMANVLMEAMCAGLPVLATRIAGSSEAVIDGATGLLVPPCDVSALAISLEALIRDPAARARMGRAGRARVESTYAWPVITDQWLDIVERIIQKRGR
ncbi:MAG: glycosyltransferase family 4 protein [Rhodospirillaceae bacterium]